MPDDFQISITGDVSGLTSALDEARSSAEETGEALKSSMEGGGEGMAEAAEGGGEAMAELKEKADGLLEGLTKLTGGWTGLLEVLGVGAVGEVMESIAQTTMSLGDNMRNTGAALGVGASEARGFMETMESLGVSSTAAAMAIRRLEMDAASGGKQLSRLKDETGGVVTANKSGIEVFQQVVEKINNISDAGQRAQAAYSLLGRGGVQLLGVMNQLNSTLEENVAEQKANEETNRLAEQQALALHSALTKLESAWNDGVVHMAPLVVSALKIIDSALVDIIGYCNAAAIAIQNVFTLGGKFGEVVAGTTKVTADMLNLEGGHGTQDQVDQLNADTATLRDTTKSYADAWLDTGNKIKSVLAESGQKSADLLDEAMHRPTAAQEGLVGGLEAAIRSPALIGGQTGDGSGQFAPKAAGGGGRGGGGGADPMAGMSNALDKANEQVAGLQKKMEMLGSETQMAAKEGGLSFDQLRDKAQNDYAVMMQKYKEFTAAVDSGSKQAAQQADAAWHLAAQNFQKDWDQARAKATQDMAQIKSEADKMASEVSGILNSAISGKLNWQQEFDKILGQMLDNLIKRCFEMASVWIQTQMQEQASSAAGQSNMLGQLANFFAQGLQMLMGSKATTVAANASTGASGAYASAAPIPYVGWAIAPEIAAAAFSAIDAYAEQGFDVPPGASPVTQLHPSEMVLPASLAENVRNMTGGGRGGSGVHNTMNIQSLDPSSLADIVSRNPDLFGKAVAQHRRNGGRFATG